MIARERDQTACDETERSRWPVILLVVLVLIAGIAYNSHRQADVQREAEQFQSYP